MAITKFLIVLSLMCVSGPRIAPPSNPNAPGGFGNESVMLLISLCEDETYTATDSISYGEMLYIKATATGIDAGETATIEIVEVIDDGVVPIKDRTDSSGELVVPRYAVDALLKVGTHKFVAKCTTHRAANSSETMSSDEYAVKVVGIVSN